jgi:hypothetical protein
MKYLIPALICVVVACVAFVGCGGDGGFTPTQPTTQPAPVDPLAEKIADISFFSSTGTTLVLAKYKVPVAKLTEVRDYVDAVRLLIVTPNQPDFDGARKLVGARLPEGTRAVGLAIVDIVERYVPRKLPKIEGQNAEYMQMATAAMDGVLKGITRYELTLPATQPAS